MNVRVKKDRRQGIFFVRFLLENFTDDEIFYLARYGPFKLTLPPAAYQRGDRKYSERLLATDINELPSYEFYFGSSEPAEQFVSRAVEIVKTEFDSFIVKTEAFVGEEVFEVRAGEEIKKINEGAKKVLDKNSAEHKEIVERNREAWKKLSEL
jgi:hypothetical protein